MKYPGLAIIGILILAVVLASMNATVLLWLLVIVIILLPPKYDPAIQFKMKQNQKKETET